MRTPQPSARSCIPYITPNDLQHRVEHLKQEVYRTNANLDMVREQAVLLEQEALLHSVSIEMNLTAAQQKELDQSAELQRFRQQYANETLYNLQFSWEFLLGRNRSKLPYDQDFFIRLQRNIEPGADSGVGYRQGEAYMNGEIIRTKPHEEMPRFISFLNCAITANDYVRTLRDTLPEEQYTELHKFIYFGIGKAKDRRWNKLREEAAHPLDLATFAHMEIERIHPFSDGNGRLGRLMMNGVLRRYGYPVAVIPLEERPHYIALVDSSVEMVRARLKKSTSYRSFGTYIGMKVEQSLEHLIGISSRYREEN
jgi:hypothetical protein